jgi:hypothetical protein
VALAEDLPGLDAQQHGKDVGEVAEDHQENVGHVGTGPSRGVLHLPGMAGIVAPGRIAHVVGEQRHQQVQAQRAHGDQRTFLESVVHVLTPERHGSGTCGGFLQNASIPAPDSAS